MLPEARSLNRVRRSRYRWRSAFAAACAARLVTTAPVVQAAPVIIIDVTNAPLSESPTANTDFQSSLGFILGGSPSQFTLKIDDPNAFGGNYRFYTFPAGGSLDSSSSWDYGDYLLKTEVAHFAPGSTSVVVDSVTNFTKQQPLPGATDSVVFGYLGPDGKTTVDVDRVPLNIDAQSAYRVNLGSQTYAETIVGFFGQPANASITLNLGGTYVSTNDARLEGQQIIVQGNGTFGSNDTIFVAGNVTVNSGSLVAPTIIIDNDNAYLGQTPSSGAPTYGAAAPTSTTLTLNGANAKINTSGLAVGDDSSNGPATLTLQNGASVTTGFMFSGNVAGSDGRIVVDQSTLNANGYIDIGVFGKGALTVQNSGRVSETGAGNNLVLGFHTGSTGVLTVTGTDSRLKTDGSIFVGGGGAGTDGGTGTMTVTDAAGVITGDALYVGNSGSATDTLTISGGADVISAAASGNPSAFSGIVGSSIFVGTATVTLTGATSAWDNQQSLAIGSHGTATVTVSNGATLEVEGSLVEIGHFQGGNGTLTFDQAGADNSIFIFKGGAASKLIIGDQGTGNFNVQGGAQINNQSSVILGNAATGVGQASVSGAGSQWTITGDLTIGLNGSGTLTIADGDTVSVTGKAILGDQNGGSGTLTLAGPGSKLSLTTSGNTLMIGNHGTGTLVVQDGASVTLPATSLGQQTDGSGNITVDGKSSDGTTVSSVKIDGNLTIGAASGMAQQQSNALTITGGGQVTSGQTVIGDQPGSFGTAQISGQDSQWTITNASGGSSPDLTVGSSGRGVFDLSNHASFTAGAVTLGAQAPSGNNAGGTGTVTIEGATGGGGQTTFKTTGPLFIGDGGIGRFSATGGAQVISNGGVVIGYQPTSALSTATISDPGTLWTIKGAGLLVIGNGGAGLLTVQNGATVDASGGNVTLGTGITGPNSQGTLTVTGDGSTFKADSVQLTNGTSGSNSATLNALLGGQVDLKTLNFTPDANSVTILVDGKSSTGTPSLLTVGQLIGDGFGSPSAATIAITVSNQGQLTVQSASDFLLSSGGGKPSTLTVASGATFAAGETVFSIFGGTLNVSDGGSLTTSDTQFGGATSPSTVTIGDAAGAPATWNIGEGNNSGDLTINFNGTLMINKGGTVTVAGSVTEVQSSAVITVNGANAVLTINGQSFTEDGELNVMGGGVINAANANMTIGGLATLGGTGSSLSANTLTVGDSTAGRLLLNDSSKVTVARTVTVSQGSTLDLTGGGGMAIGLGASAGNGQIFIGPGGSLKANGTVDVFVNFLSGLPDIQIAPFGALGGGGTVNGRLVSNSGLVSPGDPQTFTINGSYAQGPAGTLQLQIAGTGAANSDHLVVTGQATLGGYLELDFINGFAPKAGDIFDLLNFGSTSGQFANVQVTGLQGGWTFTLNPTGTTLSLTSTSNAVYQPEFLVPFGPNTILTGVTSDQTVHFLGGVLEATRNTTLSNPVILDLNGGTFQADAGTASILSGVISGPGSFTKTGPGLLTLTSVNLYLGGTAINGGVLAIFSDSNLGAAGSPLSFDGGVLRALASFTTSRGIALNSGGGTIDTNGFDSTLTGVISGIGGLIKVGAGVLSLEARNTYTGPTIVEEGKLYIDGAGAGDVDVLFPGFLGGHGWIGGGLVNGGIVSPGNSPGTLHIGGNYTQYSTGLLRIEIGGIGPSQHDLLSVGGTASLNGTLQLVQLNNFNLKRNQSVTFLTANGGVYGTFANVVSDLTSNNTILQPTVFYGSNSVALAAVQGSFAALAGLTPNQQAVAHALDSATGDHRTNSLFDYLDYRTLNKLPGDLDKIAPEELTSVYTLGVSLANVQSQNVQRRTDDIRSGSSGFSAAGLAVNGTGPSYSGSFDITNGVASPSGDDGKESKEMKEVAPAENRWGVFLSGTGEWVSVGNTDNARGYDLTSGGFTLGVDYKVCPNFAIGLMAGYTGTTSDLTDRGRVWVNGGKVGIYATTFVGGWYADAAVDGGYNSYDTRRSALQGEARGDTDGGELNALFGTGYDFKAGGLTVGPTATFNYTNVGTNGFTEHGSLAPLNIHGGTGESLRTAVGFKASYNWKCGGILIKPEIRAAWQHEYGDTASALDSSFANGAGGTFTVNGPKLGRDSALLGAGVAIQFNERMSTYFYYDGELGRTNYQSTSVTGGVRVAF